MRIDSLSRIHHPLATVYRVYRDHLPGISEYMPDIKEIVVRSREETPIGPKLLNEWIAQREIPSVAQRIVKPEMLRWEDRAQWNDEGNYVDWTLVIPAFAKQVRCSGRNTLSAEGEGTIVHLTGQLTIDLKEVRGVPRLLHRKVAPMVEEFIIKLVTPNLERTNAMLERYIDDHPEL